MLSNEFSKDVYPTRVGSIPKLIERIDPVVYKNIRKSEEFPLSEKEVELFEKNGYAFFPSLFSEKEVHVLFSELMELCLDKKAKVLPQYILEPNSKDVRSIFEVHKNNFIFNRLSSDKRIVNILRQLLVSEVYIHQSRVNVKPGFDGQEFYWHSDFETWHAEDGMSRMRAISCSINLTENNEFNGPLMVIPGSHKYFISCVGRTPENHYKVSLKRQQIGTPDKQSLEKMVRERGLVSLKGPPGSALFFDCNIMHGSNGNITPYPRSNVFFVYNSIHNKLVDPFCGLRPRPEYIASRDFTPVNPEEQNFEAKH